MDWTTLSNSIPGAITVFFTILATVVGGVIKVAKVLRAGDDARAQKVANGEQPTPPHHLPAHAQPYAQNPFGPGAPTDKLLADAQLLQAKTSLARTEWQLQEIEREMEQVRRDMHKVSEDQRRTADALVRETEARKLVERKLEAAMVKAETAERVAAEWRAEAQRLAHELEASEARCRAIADELARCKGQAGASHTTTSETAITPIRPPKR